MIITKSKKTLLISVTLLGSLQPILIRAQKGKAALKAFTRLSAIFLGVTDIKNDCF